MADSPWPWIRQERQALVDDLTGLSADRWTTPSACDQWTVAQVLAHLTSLAKLTPPKFIGTFLTSGFSIDGVNAKGVAAESAGGPEHTLSELRSRIAATTSPPGPADSWLGETLVHSEDIRQPLGIKHEYPVEALTRAIEFYRGSNLVIGGKKRVAGLTLKATDTDWAAGSGPVVEGPALALLRATTGRSAALDELSGPGLDLLRTR